MQVDVLIPYPSDMKSGLQLEYAEHVAAQILRYAEATAQHEAESHAT